MSTLKNRNFQPEFFLESMLKKAKNQLNFLVCYPVLPKVDVDNQQSEYAVFL